MHCPPTASARDAGGLRHPLVLKPRWGSDSIGLRVLRTGPIPRRLRTDRAIAQERVPGFELTVGVLGEHVGAPLRIVLPEGAPYSFLRKYLWRPNRLILEHAPPAAHVSAPRAPAWRGPLFPAESTRICA